MYDQIKQFIINFCASRPSEAVDGEYYDAPGTTVYKKTSIPLPEKGRLEINQLCEGAPKMFEWEFEVTIKDKSSDNFIHLLLRLDKSLVETYGKTVIEVDNARATEILDHLERLSGDEA